MSVETVRTYLTLFGLQDKIQVFDASSATVPLAALAVGVQEARIAKTLSFRGPAGGALLVVCAGDARVDNPKFKATFQTKARMLSADEAQATTGHAVGGVCPFALLPGVQVFLDSSLKRFDTVFPAAGSANSAVEMTPLELEKTTGGQWVDVCRVATAPAEEP